MIWPWIYFAFGFGIWAYAILHLNRRIVWVDLIMGMIITFFWPLIILIVLGWSAYEVIKLNTAIRELKKYEDKRASKDN